MTSIFLDHPQQRDDRREYHQQPPRPRGRLADQWSDRLIGDGINGRASWHAGSVTAGRSVAVNLENRLRRACVSDNIRTTCTATLMACPTTHRRATLAPRTRPTRGKYWWLRWVIIGVAAVVLTVELVLVWDQLAKGLEEPLLGEMVVGAGGHRRGDVVDAQLRADSAHPAEVGRCHGQAVAFRVRLLRGQRAIHHAARWPGAIGHVHLPPTADLGRVTGGRVVAAGDVGRAAGGRAGAARFDRRVHAGREQKPTVAYLFARRLSSR